jgi:4-hydroxy-tetrahydrodipicolinate synthase
VIPKELVQLSSRARSGDQTVRADYARFAELNRLMGVEPNPIPVKMALFQMGIIRSPEMRLPLVRMTAENSKLLAQQLKTLGLKTLGQV